MRYIGDSIIYDADDEEPDCMICDCYDSGLCDQCGSIYGWHYYERKIPIIEKSDK